MTELPVCEHASSVGRHHTYDPAEQILYRGDGRRQSAKAIGSTISTYAGTGALFGAVGDGGPATEAPVAPAGLAVGPDGSLYIAAPAHLLVRRVTPDGIIRTVAGNTGVCPGGVDISSRLSAARLLDRGHRSRAWRDVP